ncbi:MAG: CYTH domain-containing protein [Lachnospiraceae bacterium]|nr:CYTH domain-containing protein [Lachnospiraceae bacterium]
MEIERKFLIKKLPENLETFPCLLIEQAYLCTDPVVRVRRQDNDYYMTYKGRGLMAREEYNLPLNSEAYEHLKAKADGRTITKKRYCIPLGELTIELDIFSSPPGLIMAEVEFPTKEAALSFTPPEWFAEDVTRDSRYHNSNMI